MNYRKNMLETFYEYIYVYILTKPFVIMFCHTKIEQTFYLSVSSQYLVVGPSVRRHPCPLIVRGRLKLAKRVPFVQCEHKFLLRLITILINVKRPKVEI